MGVNGTGTYSDKNIKKHRLFSCDAVDTAALQSGGTYAMDVMITLVAIAKVPEVAWALRGPVKRSPQVKVSEFMNDLVDNKLQLIPKRIKVVLVFDGARCVCQLA